MIMSSVRRRNVGQELCLIAGRQTVSLSDVDSAAGGTRRLSRGRSHHNTQQTQPRPRSASSQSRIPRHLHFMASELVNSETLGDIINNNIPQLHTQSTTSTVTSATRATTTTDLRNVAAAGAVDLVDNNNNSQSQRQQQQVDSHALVRAVDSADSNSSLDTATESTRSQTDLLVPPTGVNSMDRGRSSSVRRQSSATTTTATRPRTATRLELNFPTATMAPAINIDRPAPPAPPAPAAPVHIPGAAAAGAVGQRGWFRRLLTAVVMPFYWVSVIIDVVLWNIAKLFVPRPAPTPGTHVNNEGFSVANSQRVGKVWCNKLTDEPVVDGKARWYNDGPGNSLLTRAVSQELERICAWPETAHRRSEIVKVLWKLPVNNLFVLHFLITHHVIAQVNYETSAHVLSVDKKVLRVFVQEAEQLFRDLF